MSYRFFLSLLLCLGVLRIGTAAPTTAAERLQAFLAENRTLQAAFKQVSVDEQGNPQKTSKGMFYLQKPGKFRWEYQQPFTQQIVANAGKVWFYDSDLEQVTVKRTDQSLGSTPALLLSGEVALETNFTITEQDNEQDLSWTRLEPKDKDSTFKYILIGMIDGQLAGMELSDNFGQLTRIYFSDVKTNVALDSKLFELDLPENVDVIEN